MAFGVGVFVPCLSGDVSDLPHHLLFLLKTLSVPWAQENSLVAHGGGSGNRQGRGAMQVQGERSDCSWLQLFPEAGQQLGRPWFQNLLKTKLPVGSPFPVSSLEPLEVPLIELARSAGGPHPHSRPCLAWACDGVQIGL